MTFDPDSLPDDAEFLRRIAQQLIPDREAAEDASQEVALAYLRKRPEGLRSARAWLVGALRVERLRWLERRDRRADGTSTPDEIPDHRGPRNDVAASEMCERIARETRALREPYRSVVWASLFEDEPLDSIARRLGRPHSTVRSQHMRGLELLRSRLDKRLGNRDAWVLVLLTSAGPPPSPRPADLARGGVSSVRRIAGMLAIPVLAVGTWLWLAGPPRPEVSSRPADPLVVQLEQRSGPLPGSSETVESGTAEAQEPNQREAIDAEPVAPATAPPPPESPTRLLRARVVDPLGIGVPGATIYGLDAGGQVGSPPLEDPHALVRTDFARTDSTGTAIVEVPVDLVRIDASGLLRSTLFVEAAGYGPTYQYAVTWSSDPSHDELRPECRFLLTADPIEARFRVVDEQGRPSAPAELMLMLDSAVWQAPRVDGLSATPIAHFISRDVPGALPAPSLVRGRYIISAWAEGRGLSQHVIDLQESGTVDLHPTATYSIRGRVLDAHGAPKAGIAVWETRTTYEELVPWRWRVTHTDAAGLYELRVQPCDHLELWAGDPEDENRAVRRPLDLQHGVTEGIDLVLSERESLRVRLVDESGGPLADWAAILYSRGETNVTRAKRLSDAEGRMRFPAAPDTTLTLCVFGPLPDIPPARVTIRDLEPTAEELTVVAPTLDFEYSAILGMFTTPGWTPPSDLLLGLSEPGLMTMTETSIGQAGEPFALEHVGPGQLHLFLRSPPTLFKELGLAEIPNGSFYDLGEIELSPPGRVVFVTASSTGFEAQVEYFSIECTTSQGAFIVTTVQEWPTGGFELLEGRYRAVAFDRAGSEYFADFTVISDTDLEVPLTR